MKYFLVLIVMTLFLYSKEYKNDYDIKEQIHTHWVGDLEDEHGKISWRDVDFRYFNQEYEDVFGDTIYVYISGREEVKDYYHIATKDSVLINKSIILNPFGISYVKLQYLPNRHDRMIYVNCNNIREVMFEIPKYYNHVYINFYENNAKVKTNNRYRLRMEYTNSPIIFE